MAVMALEPLIGLAEGGAAAGAGEAAAGEAAGAAGGEGGGLLRGKMPRPFPHGGQQNHAPKPQVDLIGAVHRVMGPQF